MLLFDLLWFSFSAEMSAKWPIPKRFSVFDHFDGKPNFHLTKQKAIESKVHLSRLLFFLVIFYGSFEA